jgi:hypothetical protein
MNETYTGPGPALDRLIAEAEKLGDGERGLEKSFEANLPVINEIVALAERMVGAGRTSTTALELAERLRRPLSEILRVFGILGVDIADFSEPTLYRLADIIESGTRHEVSRRM